MQSPNLLVAKPPRQTGTRDQMYGLRLSFLGGWYRVDTRLVDHDHWQFPRTLRRHSRPGTFPPNFQSPGRSVLAGMVWTVTTHHRTTVDPGPGSSTGLRPGFSPIPTTRPKLQLQSKSQPASLNPELKTRLQRKPQPSFGPNLSFGPAPAPIQSAAQAPSLSPRPSPHPSPGVNPGPSPSCAFRSISSWKYAQWLQPPAPKNTTSFAEVPAPNTTYTTSRGIYKVF